MTQSTGKRKTVASYRRELFERLEAKELELIERKRLVTETEAYIASLNFSLEITTPYEERKEQGK